MLKIVSDSSCDRPQIPGLEAGYVPMVMSTEERSFRDDEALELHGMLEYMATYKGRSYTACPSVDAWLEAFAGADCVLAVTITSGLSGSYNSAMAAKELYLQEHPDAKVHVFDSLSTGPEMRLLLEKLKEWADAGLSFEEIVERGTEYQKHTRLFFILQSVHNLAQNGRVSKVAAAAVGVLGIRIVGTASNVGTLEQLAKHRGDNKALREMIEQLKAAGYAGGRIRITNVENPELADKFAAMVRSSWPGADIAMASSSGLCGYYAERGAIMAGIETV